MLAIILGIARSLLVLPQSRKVLTAILGFALSRLLPGLSEEVRLQIVALTLTIVLGFAASDFGKEAKKVETGVAGPSMAPAVLVPSATPGGALQAVDPEVPHAKKR